MEFKFRNVNEALYRLVSGVHTGRIPTTREPSRVGEVLRVEEPVMVTYSHPRERVLFNDARDCNHFFHLFESLWMLAGRNDVKPLVYYNPRMVEFSDDGETFHGAYGHRWRTHHREDQLGSIVKELVEDPKSRRCVLQVWDTADDLGVITLDKPCNTQAYFSIRWKPEQDTNDVFLDMTVCNRSNDLIWGMLGANAVHWSMLQEYMACRIGAKVGRYTQVTNNLHVYTKRWEPEKLLRWYEDTNGGRRRRGWPGYASIDGDCLTPYQMASLYSPSLQPWEAPLVKYPERFDREVNRFVDCIDGAFEEPFLRHVAQPMMAAFRAHKQRRYRGDNNAITLAERIHAADWRVAAIRWLEGRRNNWERKNHERNPYTVRELPRQQAEAGTD